MYLYAKNVHINMLIVHILIVYPFNVKKNVFCIIIQLRQKETAERNIRKCSMPRGTCNAIKGSKTGKKGWTKNDSCRLDLRGEGDAINRENSGTMFTWAKCSCYA